MAKGIKVIMMKLFKGIFTSKQKKKEIVYKVLDKDTYMTIWDNEGRERVELRPKGFKYIEDTWDLEPEERKNAEEIWPACLEEAVEKGEITREQATEYYDLVNVRYRYFMAHKKYVREFEQIRETEKLRKFVKEFTDFVDTEQRKSASES